MKRIGIIGLFLVLSLWLAIPAWSQRGENNAYQAIQDERTPQRRIQLIEEFLNDYKNSAYRPDLDVELMNLYVGNRDWAKILLRAESFRLEVPTADAISRSAVYTRAMLAATQVNNMDKTTEFGERVLTADPNNLSALLTLSSNTVARLPQDAAARDAAINKALDYAKRVQAVPRPTTLSEDEWQRSQGRAHSTVGLIQFTKGQFAEAATEYSQALKVNPKDPDGQYRIGVAYFNLILTAIPVVQATMKAVNDASAAKADSKQLDELVAKREAAAADMLEKRDLAIESLARAVALGAAPARTQLETLYKNKTGGSLDGLDQLISQKKAELGL